MDTIAVVSIGSFVVIVAVLVLLRMRNSRFEVKPTDILVAVLPFMVFLLATGKLQKFEIGQGGLKVETAFVEASSSPIVSQVAPLTGQPSEPIRFDPKVGVEEIPQLIARKTEGLLFRLGHGGFRGQVCPYVGFSQRSEGFFSDGRGVRVVWSVSGSKIG